MESTTYFAKVLARMGVNIPEISQSKGDEI